MSKAVTPQENSTGSTEVSSQEPDTIAAEPVSLIHQAIHITVKMFTAIREQSQPGNLCHHKTFNEGEGKFKIVSVFPAATKMDGFDSDKHCTSSFIIWKLADTVKISNNPSASTIHRSDQGLVREVEPDTIAAEPVSLIHRAKHITVKMFTAIRKQSQPGDLCHHKTINEGEGKFKIVSVFPAVTKMDGFDSDKHCTSSFIIWKLADAVKISNHPSASTIHRSNRGLVRQVDEMLGEENPDKSRKKRRTI